MKYKIAIPRLAVIMLLLSFTAGQVWASAGAGHTGGGHGGSGGGHVSGRHGGGGYGNGGHQGGGHIAAGYGHGGRHHGGGHFGGHVGVFVGPAFGYYYPTPYYYPYPPVTVAPSPPVYIERNDQQAEAQTYYWYYCANPEGYYPYVKECPGGWQQVVPRPAP